MPILSVSVPDKLLDEIDNIIKNTGFASRSEFVREALRYLISRYQIQSLDEKLVTAITAMWDYHRNDIGTAISRIREKNDPLLLGNFHLHVTEAYCLDVLIATGPRSEILQLITNMREIKGIDGVDFLALPVIDKHKAHTKE